MNRVRHYLMAFISLVVTLLLTLIADVILKVSYETTYMVFAMGLMITLTTTLLEKEIEGKIKDEIRDKLELYDKIVGINDVNLQNEVYQLVQSLSDGEIPAHIASIRALNLWRNVIHHVNATDLSFDKETLYRWEASRLQIWYRLNLEAIKRGVNIERIFILPRGQVIDNGKWDPRVLNILKQQDDDGISVRVLWIEDATQGDLRPQGEIMKNIVIFDDKEVAETTRLETKLYREPSKKVYNTIKTFEEALRFSRELKIVLKETQK